MKKLVTNSYQFFYSPKIDTATLKYTSKAKASTIVVINGEAITAGSKPNFFAPIGKMDPTNFAITTVIANVIHTAAATITETLSINNNLTKLQTAKTIEQRNATLNSLNTTLNISLNSI